MNSVMLYFNEQFCCSYAFMETIKRSYVETISPGARYFFDFADL